MMFHSFNISFLFSFQIQISVKPFLIRGPLNQIVVDGSSVTFQCRVGGDPMPDVLWRRTSSGGNMPLGNLSLSVPPYCFACVCLPFYIYFCSFLQIEYTFSKIEVFAWRMSILKMKGSTVVKRIISLDQFQRLEH